MINLGIGILYVSLGLFLIGLCWPLKQRKIKPNRWYGFRFRESFLSNEHWYRINEYGARRLMPWGALLMGIGVVPLAYGIEAPGRSIVCSCLPWIPLALLFPVLQSYLFARSLSEQGEE